MYLNSESLSIYIISRITVYQSLQHSTFWADLHGTKFTHAIPLRCAFQITWFPFARWFADVANAKQHVSLPFPGLFFCLTSRQFSAPLTKLLYCFILPKTDVADLKYALSFPCQFSQNDSVTPVELYRRIFVDGILYTLLHLHTKLRRKGIMQNTNWLQILKELV